MPQPLAPAAAQAASAEWLEQREKEDEAKLERVSHGGLSEAELEARRGEMSLQRGLDLLHFVADDAEELEQLVRSQHQELLEALSGFEAMGLKARRPPRPPPPPPPPLPVPSYPLLTSPASLTCSPRRCVPRCAR